MTKSNSQFDIESTLRQLGSRVNLTEANRLEMKRSILSGIAGIAQAAPSGKLQLSWANSVVAILLILGSGGLTFANQAAPGDLLYPVDQWAETVSAKLVRDDLAKAKLYSSFAEERLTELDQIANRKARHQTNAAARQARLQALQKASAGNLSKSLEQLSTVKRQLESQEANLPDGIKKDQVRGVLRYFQLLEKAREDRLEAIEEVIGDQTLRQEFRQSLEEETDPSDSDPTLLRKLIP